MDCNLIMAQANEEKEHDSGMQMKDVDAVDTENKTDDDISDDIKENVNQNKQKEKTKILFLDIDGVMNGADDDWVEYNKYLFIPDKVSQLKEILKQTKCNIVLSTAWRRSEEGKKKIKEDFTKQDIEWNIIYLNLQNWN